MCSSDLMGDDDLMDQQRGSSYVSGRMDVVIKVSPKRMVFKGRATGQQQYPIHQDERGFIHVEREAQDAFTDAYRIARRDNPEATDNQLADTIARTIQQPRSTVYRKVRQLSERR